MPHGFRSGERGGHSPMRIILSPKCYPNTSEFLCELQVSECVCVRACVRACVCGVSERNPAPRAGSGAVSAPHTQDNLM